MKQVVIIGGGFSGTVTAVNLARLSVGPLKITIVNKGYPLARGIAYSTRNGNHLLNVAARNMSAFVDQPTHFVEWLQTRSEFYEEPLARIREKFVPRRIYGDYIHSLLLSFSNSAAKRQVYIETVAQEALDIVPVETGGASVILADGNSIHADKVVLATGNQAPGNLKIKGLEAQHPRYFQNPWMHWETKLADRTQNVILIGTGLTMIDLFISLQDMNWAGKIYAISRNGLLPLSHFKGVEYPDLMDPKTQDTSLHQMLALFKKHQQRAKSEGINPAIVVDKLRPVTQQIWNNFTLREKKQFNRHFRTRWNVARHRIAQSIHQQLLVAIAAHRLEIVKGRLAEVKDCGDQFVVTVKTGNTYRRIEGGELINCTGPGENCARAQSPLYEKLFSRGLAQPDEMDMGIKATPDFAVVNKNGQPSNVLFALGPMLKGTLWETSAVPELRSQTFHVAETIACQLSGKTAAEITEVVEPVLEYEI